MSQGKRKKGKGPKSKKTRITLPLFADLNEDSDEIETMPDIPTSSSGRQKKQGGNIPKRYPNCGYLLQADHSSDGDDHDDLAESVNDSVVEQEDEITDTHNDISHRKKRPTHMQENRNIAAMQPNSSSESDSSDDEIQDLAAKHFGKFTGVLPDYDTFSHGEFIKTPNDT